jgi:hypothetical protein
MGYGRNRYELSSTLMAGGWCLTLAPIQGVTLDLWETLLFERKGYDAKRCRIRCRSLSIALGECGVSATPEALSDALGAMGPWLSEIWNRDEDVTHMDQLASSSRANSLTRSYTVYHPPTA